MGYLVQESPPDQEISVLMRCSWASASYHVAAGKRRWQKKQRYLKIVTPDHLWFFTPSCFVENHHLFTPCHHRSSTLTWPLVSVSLIFIQSICCRSFGMKREPCANQGRTHRCKRIKEDNKPLEITCFWEGCINLCCIRKSEDLLQQGNIFVWKGNKRRRWFRVNGSPKPLSVSGFFLLKSILDKEKSNEETFFWFERCNFYIATGRSSAITFSDGPHPGVSSQERRQDWSEASLHPPIRCRSHHEHGSTSLLLYHPQR